MLSTEIKARRIIIRGLAKFLLAQPLRHSEFPFDVKISNAGIKEWLNQPHVHYAEKNESLLMLPELFARAEYLGPMLDAKERPDVKYSHVFKTQIANDDSWIIVHEMTWGEYWLHNISDGLSPRR